MLTPVHSVAESPHLEASAGPRRHAADVVRAFGHAERRAFPVARSPCTPSGVAQGLDIATRDCAEMRGVRIVWK